MARIKSRARRRMMGRPISAQTGCWIKYQLNLRNITLKTAAKNAGVNKTMITAFLKGNKDSERVKNALAATLGYTSFEALLVAGRKNGEVV